MSDVILAHARRTVVPNAIAEASGDVPHIEVGQYSLSRMPR